MPDYIQIYIASPFFDDFERTVRDLMEQQALEIATATFRPDKTEASKKYANASPEERPSLAKEIFQENLRGIQESECLIYPSYTTDLGTLFEVGYALSLNKKIFKYDYLSDSVHPLETSAPLPEFTLTSTKISIETPTDAVWFGYCFGKGYHLSYSLEEGRRDNVMFAANFERGEDFSWGEVD